MQQIETPTRWSLKDLLAEPVDQTLTENFSKLEQVLAEFEAMRKSLVPEISENDFRNILSTIESVNTLTSRLEAYADLLLTEDTQNPYALNLRDRVDQVLTDINNRMLFFDLWFKDLPDEDANRLIEQSGDLRYFLTAMRQFKPFTLSEAEEKMINIKDVNGIDALVNLYDLITNRFVFSLQVDGEQKSLTRDQLGAYFRHPLAEVRKAAYQELYRVYEEQSAVLGQIYLHRVRDWNAEAVELRGYASAISARNLSNDLPDEVVDTLLDVCRKNVGLFQRYFQLKADWLGISLDKLSRYDIYAPLVESDKTFGYDEAKRMVMESFSVFSPQVAELAQRVFDERHLDSESRPGKRGGAFCYGVLPNLTPWVMVNYEGRARDVATLAHELGHAIHNMLATGHSIMTFHASLPLAETASVFAEMQLIDLLLKRETDSTVRRDLLAYAIDDAYVTVIRQGYFTLFERDAYRMIDEGATIEALTAAYLDNLKEQFGDALEIPDEFKWEWLTVPHMYNVPFYTYAYSFGQLLVLALYQQHRLEGEAFVPKYLKILSYGGSESPMKILSNAGLDVTSPAFWQGGFDFIKNMIEELEQLSD
ncbi:MAG TPA: M3 family oligoendopeptidase [Anaerolineales bacterium]|nr:M3 family oligoendopeptidase [Anaerolineales bacterium]